VLGEVEVIAAAEEASVAVSLPTPADAPRV
jgi:hypothetical protein